MLDRIFRNLKERILYPPAVLAGIVLHPDIITIFSFAAGIASVYFILEESLTQALIFWIVNRVLDGLDGTTARVSGKVSDFGAYLDIVLDFIIYAAIPAAFVYSRADTGTDTVNYALLSILLSVYYVNAAGWLYLSAILEKRKSGAAANGELTSVTMPEGIADGTMTVIVYTLFFIFPRYINILFGVFIILVVLTIIQRMLWAFIKLR